MLLIRTLTQAELPYTQIQAKIATTILKTFGFFYKPCKRQVYALCRHLQSQAQTNELFNKEKRTISEHIKNMFHEGANRERNCPEFPDNCPESVL